MDRDAQDLAAVAAIVKRAGDRTDRLQQAMDYLHEHRDAYHWVGIYRLEGDMLLLGPYNGPETDHARIPVGRGVCGTAVAENRNQVVGDVRALTNYLACNLETRSEIVVLIREPGSERILGQIDVDGTRVDQFGPAEERFLTAVAAHLAPLLLA
jgi:GAF domain-containing protein